MLRFVFFLYWHNLMQALALHIYQSFRRQWHTWGKGEVRRVRTHPLQMFSALSRMLSAFFCPVFHFKTITILKVFYIFTKFFLQLHMIIISKFIISSLQPVN